MDLKENELKIAQLENELIACDIESDDFKRIQNELKELKIITHTITIRRTPHPPVTISHFLHVNSLRSLGDNLALFCFFVLLIFISTSIQKI